jgi:menaquinone-specific isochorismate synthase
MTPSDLALVAQLQAISRPIDAPVDLLAHLGHDGFAWFGDDCSFVTAGAAAEIEPALAAELLASIEHQADAGTPIAAGAIAHGALPFSGTANLVVPARVVGIDADGNGWFTTIGSDSSALAPIVADLPSPSHYTIDAVANQAEWRDAVDAVLKAIALGDLEKVVLAREVRIDADAPFDVGAVLRRLCSAQSGCFVFADRGFVGATPELLVRRRGDRVTCRPMAGTIPRDGAGGEEAARLLGSRKDSNEHALVVSAVTRVLENQCVDVTARGPEVARFADVMHLVTHIGARTADPSTTALALAFALHPTPAVAGTPREDALEAISRLEPTSRGNYAGPVGWVNADGDGEFAVALRCAQLDGRHARLHAGAGIVAGSDPDAEWDETSAKLEPMLRALVRPYPPGASLGVKDVCPHAGLSVTVVLR